MSGMDARSTALLPTRLPGAGQLYVSTVGALALMGEVTGDQRWYVAFVVLTLPLSLVALWVSFYAGLAVGMLVGLDPGHVSWPVTLVSVAVWTTTAWVNAQLARKVWHRGWAAVAPRPWRDDSEDPEDPAYADRPD